MISTFLKTKIHKCKEVQTGFDIHERAIMIRVYWYPEKYILGYYHIIDGNHRFYLCKK